jgi:hypothetical protein
MNPIESFDIERQRLRDERQYQKQQQEQMRHLEHWNRTKADKEVEDEACFVDVELMDHLRSLMPKNPEPKPHLKVSSGSNCKNGTSLRIGRTGFKMRRKNRHQDLNEMSLMEREKLQREALMKSFWKRKDQPMTDEVYCQDIELINHIRFLMGKEPIETGNLKVKVIENGK